MCTLRLPLRMTIGSSATAGFPSTRTSCTLHVRPDDGQRFSPAAAICGHASVLTTATAQTAFSNTCGVIVIDSALVDDEWVERRADAVDVARDLDDVLVLVLSGQAV